MPSIARLTLVACVLVAGVLTFGSLPAAAQIESACGCTISEFKLVAPPEATKDAALHVHVTYALTDIGRGLPLCGGVDVTLFVYAYTGAGANKGAQLYSGVFTAHSNLGASQGRLVGQIDGTDMVHAGAPPQANVDDAMKGVQSKMAPDDYFVIHAVCQVRGQPTCPPTTTDRTITIVGPEKE